MSVKVEGVDALTKWFDKMPKEMMKESRRLLKSAAKPWAAKIRAATPYSQWGKLVKVKTSIRKGRVYMNAGLYKDDGWHWAHAYWNNYGTLARRDTSHSFTYAPRRPKKTTRNTEGVPARNFFDPATEGGAQDVAARLVKGLEEYVQKQNE